VLLLVLLLDFLIGIVIGTTIRFSSCCVVSYIFPVGSLACFFGGSLACFFSGGFVYFFSGGLACFFGSGSARFFASGIACFFDGSLALFFGSESAYFFGSGFLLTFYTMFAIICACIVCWWLRFDGVVIFWYTIVSSLSWFFAVALMLFSIVGVYDFAMVF
ncbi:32261_t:CDS:2, partial [Racocetra persica]